MNSEPESDTVHGDNDDEAALRAKVLAEFAELAKMVGADELRRALAGSFMLCANAAQRRAYDGLREEIDAYLRAGAEGEARVQRPENFVDSPDLTETELDVVTASLFGRGRER